MTDHTTPIPDLPAGPARDPAPDTGEPSPPGHPPGHDSPQQPQDAPPDKDPVWIPRLARAACAAGLMRAGDHSHP
ncbi:hypothetical protein [Burkholderia plantarii]|uniref:hypothetical protein n=1 Tax=Burkholderia plantarii TaxID=41899 RepID=UPI0018DD730E|nr:hypothetical protein [Burkholderia plantarii]MBI0330037.1 hypothetical protein [Burkholderia plantarii]